MAYQTFIPTVWNASLNRELERRHIFAKHTNREYEGDVKELGDSVRILNVGRPTIHKTNTDNKDTFHKQLNEAEIIENSSITMPIKQIAYYRYYIGDIDKQQAKNDGRVMAAYQKETAEALANDIDVYIAKEVFPKAPLFTNEFADASHKYIKIVSGDSNIDNKELNVLDFLDGLVEKARENDIPDSTKLYVATTPRFFTNARRALMKLSTDNTEIIEGKEYLKYYNLRLEWSNNVKKVAKKGEQEAYEYLTMRTDRAVAFVHPMTHAEPYRPENGFADAIKGFILYDSMITRPKEIFSARIRY